MVDLVRSYESSTGYHCTLVLAPGFRLIVLAIVGSHFPTFENVSSKGGWSLALQYVTSQEAACNKQQASQIRTNILFDTWALAKLC
jgi:hypothetical protein